MTDDCGDCMDDVVDMRSSANDDIRLLKLLKVCNFALAGTCVYLLTMIHLYG